MTDVNFKIEDRTITGDVQASRRGANVPQVSAAEFVAAIDAVFDAAPEIEAIRWTQFTPYFNDGEPCEFGSYEPRFRVAGTDEDAGDYEDGFDEVLYTYGKHTTRADRPEEPRGMGYGSPEQEAYNKLYREWSNKMYADDNRVPLIPGERGDIVVAATAALAKQWSSFEYVLQDSFGDPAEVTATREGFNVEYYDHD